MTDRIRTVTVILDEDIRTDDVEQVLSAIRHIRGVAEVVPRVVEAGDHLARTVARSELRSAMIDAVFAVFDGRQPKKGRDTHG